MDPSWTGTASELTTTGDGDGLSWLAITLAAVARKWSNSKPLEFGGVDLEYKSDRIEGFPKCRIQLTTRHSNLVCLMLAAFEGGQGAEDGEILVDSRVDMAPYFQRPYLWRELQKSP